MVSMRWIILTIVLTLSLSNEDCLEYITYLNDTFANNKTQFTKQMAPYLIYSGKQLDDLGSPSQCRKNTTHTYHTVQINIPENYSNILYYGFCFSSNCSTNDLNLYEILVDDILDLDNNLTLKFILPSFQNQHTPSSIILYIFFGIVILCCFIESFKKWRRYCREDQEDELEKLVSRYSLSLDDDEQLRKEQKTFLQSISLEINFKQLLQPQQTQKIFAISIFRFIAIPFLIFGQMFYLSNLASFNYNSFNEEVYTTFYSKLAIISYYIPDVFFFISAYLFTNKIISVNTDKQNTFDWIIQSLKSKFVRLYPMYLLIVLIFWIISPTLHSGPVWYVYSNQTEQCNTSWWRVMLLIDNWFANSCYTPAWFVQVQFQLLILTSLVYFTYFSKKMISLSLLGVMIVVFWVLLFSISAPIPSSIETTTSLKTLKYFKSFYSHAPFYLMGVLISICGQNQAFSIFIKANLIERKFIALIIYAIAITILIVIVLQPQVWSSLLGFQLALCRLGVFICCIIFLLPCMIKRTLHRTIIHKLAHLTYPIILMSGIICMSTFWCSDTFPYVSGGDFLNNLIPQTLIACCVGGFLGLLFSFLKL